MTIAVIPEPTLIEDPAAIGALQGLLHLTRSADEAPLRRVLEAAGEAIAMSTGFRLVYMNVYRPEYDDFVAMFVHGRPELSASEPPPPPIPRDFLARLPGTPIQPAPGIYFIAGTRGMWDGDPNFYPSRTAGAAGPDAWRTEDLLLMLLKDVDGEPLGLLSVDEPRSGMRPTDGELQLLRAICLYVEQALRTAKRTRQNAEDTRMLARLSEISPQMSKCLDRRELYRLLGATVAADLGFERVAVYITAGDEGLRRVHVRGWEPRELLPERLSDQHLGALLTDLDPAGALLLSASELFGPWPRPRSRRNGRGPVAWHDHSLLVPWFSDEGALAGVVIAEDPVDRLLPREQRRYSLRLLVDLAASIEHTITQRARLNQLASRDTLTGLRNRRGLHQLIGDSRDCAVMVCDLDEFKQINDRYGHEAGDLVLTRFAEVLREQTRETDVAVRLGGDEFCVVLADSDDDDAGTLVSERIRATTPVSMQGLVPSAVTVSVGLARRTNGVPSPRALLTAADAALYGAKQTGRDRTMIAGAA